MLKVNSICGILLAVFICFGVNAQDRPDIVTDINANGNITVTLPDGLATRNNRDIGKSKASAASGEEGDRPAVVKREAKPGETTAPKRTSTTNTSQQSVQGRKVGFRIQVFNDNSANAKANAQALARQIAMKFPQFRSYLSYNAPAWRLRIGDFRDQAEASAALSRVRSAFPASSGQMMLVKDNINVWK